MGDEGGRGAWRRCLSAAASAQHEVGFTVKTLPRVLPTMLWGSLVGRRGCVTAPRALEAGPGPMETCSRVGVRSEIINLLPGKLGGTWLG